jgi:hypothetical protein
MEELLDQVWMGNIVPPIAMDAGLLTPNVK